MSRPWSADDGALVRLRLIGGRLTVGDLRAVADVARAHGDGDVHLTGRANLQLRALPDPLTSEVVSSLRATGLVPSPSHELARNVMVSPLTGRAGGRTDLTAVAAELDRLLCATPALAGLPGRFLFVLDDGRGDLMDRPCDLGLVARDATRAQLRVGDAWGPVVALREAPTELVGLALAFLTARGTGPAAAWHVRELETDLAPAVAPDPGLPRAAGPLPHGDLESAGLPRAHHHGAADGVLTPSLLADLIDHRPDHDELVVTPWRGVLTWS